METTEEKKSERLEAFQAEIQQQGGMTVSSATLRTMDLIEACMSILDDVVPEQAAVIREEYAAVFAYMESSGNSWLSKDAWFADADENLADQAGWLINETLFDLMNEIAPTGYGYGSQEGDGACFGFWMDERTQSAIYMIDEGELSAAQIREWLDEACIEYNDESEDEADLAEKLKAACIEDYDLAERIWSSSWSW